MSQTTTFYGREQELAELRTLWDKATVQDEKGNYAGSPQIKIIIGETGLGKSRLVQAFYEQLGSDPVWDPPQIDYWPDYFNRRENQLHVNPISSDLNRDHKPGGPPKFLWLGSRWQSDDKRNVEERLCVIPHFRETLQAHVKIAIRNLGPWLKARRIGEKVIKSYDFTDAADVGEMITDLGNTFSEAIPFANLIKKVTDTTLNEMRSEAFVGRQQEKAHEDAADLFIEELNAVFGGFGSGGLVLPTVLWLDDAQWIDAISQKFVHQLWSVANTNNWPLFIIITHWEREWNLLKKLDKKEKESSLLAFKEFASILEPANEQHLRDYLNEKLPGLEDSQITLLIEKANGNFLTLVENVGYLLGYEELFVDEDFNNPLTDEAIDIILDWESDRYKRIEQRFRALDSTFRKLLGWSSEAGEQFLKEISLEISQHMMKNKTSPENSLDQCVDPYAILGQLNPHIYNFRDRAYYRQARKYFQKILQPKITDEQQQIIDQCWNKVFERWINNCFDNEGNLIDEESSDAIQEIRITNLGVIDQQVLLEACLTKLPIPKNPDWKNLLHKVSLRLRYLLLKIADYNSIYINIKRYIYGLENINWTSFPNDILSPNVLNHLVEILIKSGDYSTAEPICKRTLTLREEALGPYHPDTATIIDTLAGLLGKKGNYLAAESLYNRTLNIRESALGPNHLDTATSLNNFAVLLESKGDYATAKPMYQRSLIILEEALEANHPDTAAVIDNLGRLLKILGDYESAEPLFRRALEIREDSLGPDHPDIAKSLSNLAGLLQRKGNYQAAELLYRRSLKIREEVLGSNHLDTATSLNNLAGLLRERGNYEAAESSLRRVLEINEEALEPNHPDIATSLNNLALLLENRGDYAAAEPLYRRSLKIQEALVPNHPKTATSLHNLAGLLQRKGNYQAAEPLYRRSLKIREEALGSNHPDTAISLNNLACLLEKRGDYTAAEPLYRRSLKIREEVLGSNHPDIATSLDNLAFLLETKGDLTAAEPLNRRSLKIREEVLGSKHPDTAISLNNLACLLENRGDYTAAEPLYRRSLKIREEVLGSNHTSTAASLNNLAGLLKKKGNYAAAKTLYQRSLKICEEFYGSNHSNTAICLNNLARMLKEKGEYSTAIPLFKRLIQIRGKKLATQSIEKAQSLYELAFSLYKTEKTKEAESYFLRSLEIYRKELGDDHTTTKKVQEEYDKFFNE